MKKLKMKKLKLLPVALPLLALLIAGVWWFAGRNAGSREEIVITMPYNENIRSIDTNYYKEWLEEQTGLSIRFNIVRDAYSPDYLRSMFSQGYVKSDAFFSMFGGEDYADWNTVIQEFGEKGYIIPLNHYVDEAVHLNKVFEDFTDYDLRAAMTSADGNIYYMPGFDPARPAHNAQIMWVNERWMKTLGLTFPQTTEDFRAMLEAFRNGDPNGNGLADEIPLAGSNDVAGERVQDFIINAFVYNYPDNSRLYAEDGAIRFAPVTDAWREAMQYLNGLYADGLMDSFSYQHDTFIRLANDTRDVLGCFASDSITDVILQANTELINDFSHIAPLAGPYGARNATVKTPLPKPAGVITSSCKNPAAVFQLFDLMLSEEAFLIGRFGEENADWVTAGATDLNFYGTGAAVRVINQLQNVAQNKHICETGPFYAYPKYADSVTYLGFDSLHEYENARAYQSYEPFKRETHIKALSLEHGALAALRQPIDKYTDESVRAFILGVADPSDDAAWVAHLQKYEALGVQKLIDNATVTEELS